MMVVSPQAMMFCFSLQDKGKELRGSAKTFRQTLRYLHFCRLRHCFSVDSTAAPLQKPKVRKRQNQTAKLQLWCKR